MKSSEILSSPPTLLERAASAFAYKEFLSQWGAGFNYFPKDRVAAVIFKAVRYGIRIGRASSTKAGLKEMERALLPEIQDILEEEQRKKENGE